MSLQLLLLLFLAIVGLSSVVQSIALSVIAFRLGRRPNGAEDRLAQAGRKVEQAMDCVSEVLIAAQAIARFTERFDEKSSHLLGHWTGEVRSTAERLDDTLQLGYEKLRQVDTSFNEAMKRIQATTDQVQAVILRPSSEITSVVRGIRSALHYYVKRRFTEEP